MAKVRGAVAFTPNGKLAQAGQAQGSDQPDAYTDYRHLHAFTQDHAQCYSYLSATIGSTDDALRAGMRHDKPEVTTSSRMTPARISASSELP